MPSRDVVVVSGTVPVLVKSTRAILPLHAFNSYIRVLFILCERKTLKSIDRLMLLFPLFRSRFAPERSVSYSGGFAL